MKISLLEKRKIAEDWLREFPELAAYSEDKLYKIVGPFVLGLRLLKLPGVSKYRPCLMCFPLWRKTLKDCLDEPLILRGTSNNRDLQFNISYPQHTKLFAEACQCVRKQSIIPFEGAVPIRLLIDLIRDDFQQPLVKSSAVGQAKLCEAMLAAASFVGDKTLFDDSLKEVRNLGEKWEPEMFNWKYGSFAKWFKDLDVLFRNREVFLGLVHQNRGEQKFRRLCVSSLNA